MSRDLTFKRKALILPNPDSGPSQEPALRRALLSCFGGNRVSGLLILGLKSSDLPSPFRSEVWGHKGLSEKRHKRYTFRGCTLFLSRRQKLHRPSIITTVDLWQTPESHSEGQESHRLAFYPTLASALGDSVRLQKSCWKATTPATRTK